MRNSIRAQSDMRRTCSEIKSVNPDLDSGMYWIDPDGQETLATTQSKSIVT